MKVMKMLKTVKKIPISVLCRRAGNLLSGNVDGKSDCRIFDVASEWMPVPGNIQITIQRRKTSSTNTMFHNRFVLKLHLQGTSCGWVDNRYYTFRPDEGILIFPFQSHHIDGNLTPDGQLRILINFTLPPADQVKLEKLRHCVFKFDDKLKGVLAGMLQKFEAASDDSGPEVFNAAVRILQMLPGLGIDAPVVNPARNSDFEEIFSYINRNFRDCSGVKEIAEKFGYSETGLRKLFYRECGRAPGGIIRELRLREAATMLRMTKLPIREISSRCGFSNAYVFSRAFRNYFGSSPRSFR